MRKLRLMTAAEQVAGYLRQELEASRMSGMMPGVLQLERELGVNRNTMEAALRLLEKEGLLEPQGPGKRRLIHTRKTDKASRLRIGILTGEKKDRGLNYMVELQHELENVGHSVFFASKYLFDTGMDVPRVERMLQRTPADAWLVVGGSHELLKWFAARGGPVMALFGRRRDLPIASVGPDKVPAIVAITRELLRLGHRRIVLMTRRMRRLPRPGAFEQAFLDTLSAQGITPGPYHLPDWEECVDGFYKRLEALFRVTPPTALIVDEVPLFLAVQQYLAKIGMGVPQNVSLVCTDDSPDFTWCRPSVAHIRWDGAPLVRRIVLWANNVSRGREDMRQTLTPAEFVPGGTIGRAPDD